jgi:hypothetical protein
VDGTAGWAITNFLFHLLGEILPLSVLFYMQSTIYANIGPSITIERDITCSSISDTNTLPLFAGNSSFKYDNTNPEPSPQSHVHGTETTFKFGFSDATAGQY